MGHGIAQVAAQVAKHNVVMRDVEQRFLDSGMGMIKDSLLRFQKKGALTEVEVGETDSAELEPGDRTPPRLASLSLHQPQGVPRSSAGCTSLTLLSS